MEYFDKEIETMPRAKMLELQTERLKYIVNYAYNNSPFYKKKFDDVKLKPEHIKSLKDMQKIPFTTKLDFRDAYPYGMLATDMRNINRIHASSGTTGKPIIAAYTKKDINIWSDCVARFLISCGANDQDIVQISFGYGLFTGALGLHQGWEKIGAAVIPISSGNTERQVMMLVDLKPTALVSTPSYALYIGETLKRMGFTNKDLALRLGFFGAEASTKETHDEIAAMFNIRTNDNYGLTEIIGPGISSECIYKNGMHIADDHFLTEILDRETFQPLNEGEEGELVITTLTKEGMPVLRYRTKDICSISYEPCKCGRTNSRMGKLLGRTDDMLVIRGVNVFPSQIEAILMEIPETGTCYEILLTRKNHMDCIEVRVEVVNENLLLNFDSLTALSEKIHHKIKSVLQLDAKIHLVEPLSIQRYEGKVKRVKDLRNLPK